MDTIESILREHREALSEGPTGLPALESRLIDAEKHFHYLTSAVEVTRAKIADIDAELAKRAAT